MDYTLLYSKCAVPPGSWCSDVAGIDCYGGAYCYSNMCQCPYGQVMIALQCTEAPIGNPLLNHTLCMPTLHAP
jgi:hypothetical protein